MFKITLHREAPSPSAMVDGIAATANQVVSEATVALKAALRAQVVGAGLGQRLANTWQARVVEDQRGRAIGRVTTTAPHIIDGFDRGATIFARNGARWLAIPTDAVPRRPRGRRMTPVEVEAQFNRELRLIPARTGRAALLVMDALVPARSGTGFRPATDRRRAQGRPVQPVLMFTLVPQVTLPKRLDLDAAVQQAGSAFSDLLVARLDRRR